MLRISNSYRLIDKGSIIRLKIIIICLYVLFSTTVYLSTVSYEVKAGMVCLQCKNCVIHTWALQWWVSHYGVLHKMAVPLPYAVTLLFVIWLACLQYVCVFLCLAGEWTKHGVCQLRLKSKQLHRIVPELCRTNADHIFIKNALPVLHQRLQRHAGEPFRQCDAAGVLHVPGDSLGWMWMLRTDWW